MLAPKCISENFKENFQVLHCRSENLTLQYSPVHLKGVRVRVLVLQG